MAWRIAALCAALLLAGCTFSDALRNDPVRSVWGRGAPPPPRSVFFATDRQPEGSSFGQKWGASFRCDAATLVIPDGADPSPNQPDPALHSLTCNDAAGMTAFMARVTEAAKPCGRLLLIVHGYNTTFHGALLHSAQLAMDTEWPCATLLFSWSSEGLFRRYAADIERSGFAMPALLQLLRAARATGLQINILSHSMGARLALGAAGTLCGENISWSVNQMILAAPDVGAQAGNDDFGHLLERAMPCTRRATVYASDNDLAMLTSESLHDRTPRAGRFIGASLDYARKYKSDTQRVDIIDAGLAPGDAPVGHRYFMLSYEMAHDMMEVLADVPVARRASNDGSEDATLACSDAPGLSCAQGDGHYTLIVAANRQPGLGTRLIRALWPLSTRVQ
ncbi:MAG TPA: alpha/beta hydrolase [Rhizomicrobium sp.]|nr:alpha/beta hydrolase [Rhizomicrobium sp.]